MKAADEFSAYDRRQGDESLPLRDEPRQAAVPRADNQRVIRYQAHPTLRQFHEDDSFLRLVLGPVGSGKSSGMVMELLKRAHEQEPHTDGVRRTRWAIIRNSFPMLFNTTIKTFQDWVPPEIFGDVKRTSPVTHTLHQALPDGTEVHAEFIFLALDVPADEKNLLSLELTGAWVNEAREIQSSTIDLLQTRVGRYPSKMLGGCTWYGIMMDSNPPSQTHFLYKWFGEKEYPGFKLFQQPSGLSPEAENVEYLPKDYYQKLMIGKTKAWIDSYVHGLWSSTFSGKAVWPDFQRHIHVLKEDVTPPPGSELVVGIDFGLTPACVVLWPRPDGSVVAVGELTSERAGILQFSRVMKQWLREQFPRCYKQFVGDPAGNQGAQTDERTPFDVLASEGISAVPAITNDPVIRIESVTLMLTTLVAGGAWLRVSPRCKLLIDAMSGGYQYRRLQVSGDPRHGDKPDKNFFSHVADALQYAVLELRPDDRKDAVDSGMPAPMDQLLRPARVLGRRFRVIPAVTRRQNRG